MAIQEFCSTRYVVGCGCLERLSELRGERVALVVSETVIRALGLEKRLYEEILKDVEYKVIGDVSREPSMAMLAEPIKEVQEFEPTCIVAIGGGSVIDSAKAMWLFYELPHYTWEDAFAAYAVEKFPGKAKFIAVPTTSGTGSETTCCCMVKDDENVKQMILSFEIVPTTALLDYDLLRSLPPSNVAFSGTDALAHAFGAAVCSTTSELVQAVAVQAIVMLVKNLPASSKGDFEARKRVHVAATLAGQAINNAITGLEHTLATCAEVYDLPHGLVAGTLLPYVLRFQAPNPVYAEVAEQLGIPGEGVEQQMALVERIWEMYDELGMPRTLQAAGVPEDKYLERIPRIVEEAAAGFALQTAPKVPTREEIEMLLKEFYYGI